MKQDKPTVRVAGCFVFHDGHFLILHRHPDKPEGHSWDIPAGKADPGEADIDTMQRELFEETGYRASADELTYLGCFSFEKPDVYLDFVTYRLDADSRIDVVLSDQEHVDHRWVTPMECYELTKLTGIFHQLLEVTGLVQVSRETMLR